MTPEDLIPIALIGCFFFVLTASLLVFVFSKLSPKGRWVLGTILLAPFAVVGLFTAVYLASSSAHSQQMTKTATIEADGQQTSRSVPYYPGIETEPSQTSGVSGGASGGSVWVIALPKLLLLVVLPVALLIFLFVKLGRTGRIVLASLLLLLLLLASYRFARVSPDSPAIIAREHSNQPPGTPAAESADLVAAGFEPDLYASKDLAVRALGCQLAQSYVDLGIPRGRSISQMFTMYVGVDDASKSAVASMPVWPVEACKAVASAVRDDLKLDHRVFVVPSPVLVLSRTGAEAELLILLNLRVTQDPAGGTPGVVEGDIDGALGKLKRRVKFVDKPWADDFEAWSKTNDGPSWVLGRASDFSPTRREAESLATANAVTGIRTRVLASWPAQSGRIAESGERDRWLDSIIMRQLAAGQLPADRFTQEFKRPYGSVWRSAVLVHVPPKKVKKLLDAYRAQAEAQRTTWLHTLLSGAGLLAVIVAVYLFLNMATRGYYVWSVRLATVALAGVGAWCIVMFVR